jgi:hypothetical protein
MLPQAIAASVITLLVGIGAAAAATALAGLVAALVIASAASVVPIIGIASGAAVIAATVAIFLFINFVVPPLVEGAIKNSISEGIVSEDSRKSLAKARLLQFAGEGIAEAIARQVITKAAEDNTQLDLPTPQTAGHDRYRQDLFQMIHVSEGRARVLIRG